MAVPSCQHMAIIRVRAGAWVGFGGLERRRGAAARLAGSPLASCHTQQQISLLHGNCQCKLSIGSWEDDDDDGYKKRHVVEIWFGG
jgi:hypothetical protein